MASRKRNQAKARRAKAAINKGKDCFAISHRCFHSDGACYHGYQPLDERDTDKMSEIMKYLLSISHASDPVKLTLKKINAKYPNLAASSTDRNMIIGALVASGTNLFTHEQSNVAPPTRFPKLIAQLTWELSNYDHDCNRSDQNAIETLFVMGGSDVICQGSPSRALLCARARFVVVQYWDFWREEEEDEATIRIARTRQLRDLEEAEELDIIEFFKKRITCSCLDEKYSSIEKVQEKTGLCSHCEERKALSSLMECGRCRVAQYCSKECQRDHWPTHKSSCSEIIGR